MDGATFAPFVPGLLTGGQHGRRVPGSRRMAGAVLMIDITGFTALTERLASQGSSGAETLADILNGAFGDVIDCIQAHGGDVVAFAGDAIQAVWDLDLGEREAVRRAAGAALDAQRALASRPPSDGVAVQARAGIATGALWVSVVGGIADELRWIVFGHPLAAAGTAAGRAAPGQVVLTAAAAVGLGIDVGLTEDHVALDPAVLAKRASSELVAPASFDGATDTEDDALAAFLPRELVSKVRAGQTEWLAEFRRLTVLFIGIHGFDAEAPGAPDTAQAAFLAVQRVIDHYGGSLNQALDDDKGTMIIAGWGLPERTYEDDAARGALAARGAVDALQALGLQASAGLGSGRCFTGILGSATRCEYTMLGDVVNLAARLMQSSRDEVRCDAATGRSAGSRVALTPVGSLVLKGKAADVEAFQVAGPLGSGAGGDGPDSARPSRARTLIGREQEWAALTERVERLATTGVGGVVVLEGEPGVGKSELVAQLIGSSTAVRWHVGEADAIERSTAYYVWRRPVLGLLVGEDADRRTLEGAVLAALKDAPELRSRASLLDAILPIDLASSERPVSLEADVRADAIRDLVVHLMSAAAAVTPRVLVLEDAHWMDSSSWELALSIARRSPHVLVVLAMRSMDDDAPIELGRLLAEPGAVRIPLGPLASTDTEALVAQGLGVDALPPGVAEFIIERAEGNPFFSEQLAFALRDAGHLVIDGARCRLADDVDLRALDVPDTVRGVLAERIDRLATAEQLTVKVASVIGRVFRYRVLADVHPLEEERPALPAHLERATRLDLTRLESPDPDRAYLFTHVITQEVAYDLLVFAQRRPLHQAVAEWYEANVDDLNPLVPLLAHHWGEAGVTDKALHFLHRAGHGALVNHANAEARSFLAEAMARDDAAGRPTPAATRADWERWTGIAFTKQGLYRDARPHFEAALELLGRPNPRSSTRRWLAIGGELGRQGWRRVHRRALPADEVDRALAVSECHRYLAEVSYWENDLAPMLHAMLASLNHAEPAGDSKELVVAFASVGFLFGLVQGHPLARYYRRLTARAGDRVGNPDASGYAAELEAVYGLVVGDWATVHEATERGVVIFQSIGDRMRWHTCFSLHGYAHLHQGHFDDARPYWREGLAALGPDGHLQGRLWSLAALLATDLAQDEPYEDVVEELQALLGPRAHHSDEVLVRGMLAVALDRSGDRIGARREALVVTPMVEGFPPPSWHTMLGIAGAAEVLLDHWAESGGDSVRVEAARAVDGLRRFARFNHAARPRAALLAGRARWIAGDHEQAREAWARARTLADALDMPYEAGRAELELAASHAPGSAARRAAVARALARFEPHGATRDAARARALLDDDVSGASAPC